LEKPHPLPFRPADGAGISVTPGIAPPPFPYTVDGPDGAPIPLHGGFSQLADHIARHFVERAARAALVTAYPSLAEIDVFASDAAAKRFMSRREQDPSLDAVARAYARVLQGSIREAAALGWTVTADRSSSVHLDSAGLLVVIGGGLVRTAFIPGVDYSAASSAREHESHGERTARLAREARWSGDERYFYRVFRPAMRTVRRFPTGGIKGDVQYGALKRVLPQLSGIGLAEWQSMRARLGHAALSR
jgi:hypothetical protein